MLSDNNGDDDYKWCYRYTLVFWNPSVIDASAFQFDESTTFVTPYPSAAAWGNSRGHSPVPDEEQGPRAVLPRGYGHCVDGDDHEVLQVGFDLGTPPLGGTIVPTGNDLHLDLADDFGRR